MSPVAVGDTLPPLVLPPVDRLTLALFADASGDHNPVHLDADHARRLGFDDVFAHGMLSMAWLGRLLTGWAPPERLGSCAVRFSAPTPLGAVATCTGTVVAVEGGVATLDVQVRLEDGTLTLSGSARIALDPTHLEEDPT